MIKGLFLPRTPSMNKYTEKEILNKLDPLSEVDTVNFSASDHNCIKKIFEAEKLKIFTMTVDKEDVFEKLFSVYQIIQKCTPELLKVFKLNTSTFVIAFNQFDGDGEEKDSYCNLKVELIIDELVRLTNFLRSNFPGSLEEIIDRYIETYVNWPGKKRI